MVKKKDGVDGWMNGEMRDHMNEYTFEPRKSGCQGTNKLYLSEADFCCGHQMR